MKYCPKCSSKQSENINTYCSNCGHQLKDNVANETIRLGGDESAKHNSIEPINNKLKKRSQIKKIVSLFVLLLALTIFGYYYFGLKAKNEAIVFENKLDNVSGYWISDTPMSKEPLLDKRILEQSETSLYIDQDIIAIIDHQTDEIKAYNIIEHQTNKEALTLKVEPFYTNDPSPTTIQITCDKDNTFINIEMDDLDRSRFISVKEADYLEAGGNSIRQRLANQMRRWRMKQTHSH
ncbi:zinc ribbon domain-containing protein [Amphibacillus jilinensis]|uniref:zinc ribbon domain-containing protein n=1 Tax=Amphibacillus jilinensis TaxID=1216008 RepID=UPI0002EB8B8A|nr:zinc ribbon domain-containing protein [Amphibacillus jilinensis]